MKKKKKKKKNPTPRDIWGMMFDGTALLQQGVKTELNNISTLGTFSTKEEKWKPKDGDILFGDKTYYTSACVVIYAGVNENGSIKSYAGLNLGNGKLIAKFTEIGFGFIKWYRTATEKEKQRLLDALAKAGYNWNPEKKELEKLPRWRADINGRYYIVNEYGYPEPYFDERKTVNDNHNEYGNYFRTEKAAERVASQIRKIFKNSKAE